MKKKQPAQPSLPESVQVAGHTVSVKITADISELGNFDLDTMTICIRQDIAQTPAIAMDTLRHELMHAAIRIGGMSFTVSEGIEEGFVRAIEQLFFPAWDSVTKQATKNA